VKACALLLVLLTATITFADVADPDSLIWVSEEAAIDSLNTYWRNLESDWYEPLTLEDLDVGLDPSRLDSLTIEGDLTIGRMIAGRPWRFRVKPPRGIGFNRVKGFDVGPRIEIYRPGVRQPRLISDVRYGFAWKRISHRHRLDLPLLTARLYDADGFLDRAPWTWLTLEAEGGRITDWFAGDMRAERVATAIFGGDDPNHYFERRYWRVGLRIAPRPPLTLRLGGGGGTHRPLAVATDWNLFGDDVADNLAAERLSHRSLYAGLSWRWRGLRLSGRHEWRRVTNAPGLPDVAASADGRAWYRHLDVRAVWQGLDGWGDTWTLTGNWRTADRQQPLPWKTYLGDHGTLRGFKARELVGDGGAWASLDARWNLDPFESLHVPLLRNLGLQPITFADWGRVHRRSGALDTYPGDAGWRADVGVGLGKFLGLGSRLQNVRLYAAKPVGAGMGERGWRFTLALEAR
jgi:hypothetical protein